MHANGRHIVPALPLQAQVKKVLAALPEITPVLLGAVQVETIHLLIRHDIPDPVAA